MLSQSDPHPGQTFDGLVTAEEVSQGWKLDADLVTLSACETAIGHHTEGNVGFAQALLRVGARSVVVSRWRVSDRATALLMQRFYENLLDTPKDRGTYPPLPRARALQEAKIWLRDWTTNAVSVPSSIPSIGRASF